MGLRNDWGLGNELGAQRAEQFPHLGNYTSTPVCVFMHLCMRDHYIKVR